MSTCDKCGSDIGPDEWVYRCFIEIDYPGTHCTYGRGGTFQEIGSACEQCHRMTVEREEQEERDASWRKAARAVARRGIRKIAGSDL